MLHVIRRMNPRHFPWVFGTLGLLDLVRRYLFSTLFGLFLFAVGLYLGMYWLSPVKPFSGQQLALWFDGLPTESKGAMGAALLTVLGFLIAFRTASVNWRDELRVTISVQAADELEEVYGEASQLMLDVMYYSRGLVEQLTELQQRCTGMTPWLRETLQKYAGHRERSERLSALGARARRLAGKYGILLNPIGGGSKAASDCAAAIERAALATILPFPPTLATTEEELERLAMRVDLVRWRSLFGTLENERAYLNTLSSMVYFALVRRLSQSSFGQTIALFRHRNVTTEAFSLIKER
jgi:hypothetical protein